MKILTQTLTDTLRAIAPVINPKSTLPILECVLMEVSPHGTVFTGTNLMNLTKRKAGSIAENTERWQVCIPFATFNAIVSTLDGVETNLTLDHHKLVLKISCGNTNSSLKCQDAAEYPSIVTPDMDNQGDSADLTGLMQALAGVSYAAASDTLRAQLSGVYVDTLAGKAVATDGYRLAVADFDAAELGHIPSVLIPSKSIRQLKAAGIDAATANIEVTRNTLKEPTGVAIWDSNTLWHTQLVAQNYVEYSALIEGYVPDGIVLSRDDLITSLATMSAIKRSGADYMTLWQDGDLLRMFARGDEVDSKLSLPVISTRGRGLVGQVSCNIDFLLSSVKADGAPEISFTHLGDNVSVSKLIVAGAYTHTIVPMNVPQKLEAISID